MLIRAHGTGINVDIWVQLLRRDLQPPRLQQPAQRGRGDALSQSGNNAACHENILCHVPPSHRKFKKEKDAHIRAVEKGIKKQYTPQMKKLTYSQGKLLIKLVDRECNQSSFEIVKAFFGPFKAGFYQTFASIFGASLKKDYDPEADDRLTERVVRMVEAGTL